MNNRPPLEILQEALDLSKNAFDHFPIAIAMSPRGRVLMAQKLDVRLSSGFASYYGVPIYVWTKAPFEARVYKDLLGFVWDFVLYAGPNDVYPSDLIEQSQHILDGLLRAKEAGTLLVEKPNEYPD